MKNSIVMFMVFIIIIAIAVVWYLSFVTSKKVDRLKPLILAFLKENGPAASSAIYTKFGRDFEGYLINMALDELEQKGLVANPEDGLVTVC